MYLKSIIILLFLQFFVQYSSAQDQSISFPANELQDVSQRLSGSALNWPLVVNMAQHNSTSNKFTLTSSDILRLQNFSILSNKVTEQQARVQQIIASGAAIFAPEELSETQQIISEYKSAVRDGSFDDAVKQAGKLESSVDFLEETMMENRLVNVQAQLTKKDGDVDKRSGLLGSWKNAFIGDLFKEWDGLRTMIESYASLTFVDGSNIIVNPNTVAVIRKSRIDKLDESSDTEISLENGGLLAKLSASGKEKSKYVLKAGPAVSQLKTQNLYAETEGAEKVKFANYDGEAIISANNITISIKKNEGTVVEEGSDPLPPIKLLPAPELLWTISDSIIYRDDILYSWMEVENAVSYHIQYSNSQDFDGQVNDIHTTQLSTMIEDLPLGTTYVRVQATDELGLRGPYSKNVRIIRNIDNQPPPLFVNDARNDILFTLQNSVTISGVTEPDASLTVDGSQINTSGSGQFTFTKNVLELDQVLEISSKDDSGNETKKQLRIIKLTEEVLYNFNFRGAAGGEIISTNQPVFTISGDAYPWLEVEVTLGEQSKIVQTDTRGRWGVSINSVQDSLSIQFKNAYSGKLYFTKTFTVEANLK